MHGTHTFDIHHESYGNGKREDEVGSSESVTLVQLVLGQRDTEGHPGERAGNEECSSKQRAPGWKSFQASVHDLEQVEQVFQALVRVVLVFLRLLRKKGRGDR